MSPAPRASREPSGADAPTRVAILARQGKFLVAEPFFGPGPRQAVSRDKRYDVGDLVLLGAPRGGSGGGGGGHGKGGSRRPTIERRLGRPDVARDVIGALMIDRGLRRGFADEVEREARAAADSGPAVGSGSVAGDGDGRRDLRELATFTIDPVTARDFDDAISATALPDGEGGGWRVWVHIADVSRYVTPRSALDREAYRRATSVYVPGTVEPMLPRALSDDACSLVPGADRATVTVEMTVGERGVRRSSMYRSLIRSDVRLDYDRVDRIFAGAEGVAEPWGEPLGAARAAAGVLGSLRRSAGSAVVLDSAEPEFSFDRAGHVVSEELSVQTESHRLIEALMIAANEQVASFLDARGVPTLYRIHERPEPMAIERLVEQLASLGVPTPPVPEGGHMSSQQAGELAGEISAMVSQWVARRGGQGARALNSLVLRSLKQAVYDDRNRGHTGLASSGYCHFTSPIRRYPDLICHRALLSAVDGSEPVPDAAWVHAAGPWTSTREREAMVIERDADDIARCFLLERQLFESAAAAGSGSGFREAVFSGEVIGLIGAGAFVAFGVGLRYQGLLPVRRLRGDWWELNDEATMLIGTRNGGRIRLGDTVEVRVGGIDAPRGRVDLLPASDSGI